MDSAPHTQPTLLLNLNEVATQLRWTRRSVERQISGRRLRGGPDVRDAAHAGPWPPGTLLYEQPTQ